MALRAAAELGTALPLSRACVCLSCPEEPIFDIRNRVCPWCGSSQVVLVVAWLNRRRMA